MDSEDKESISSWLDGQDGVRTHRYLPGGIIVWFEDDAEREEVLTRLRQYGEVVHEDAATNSVAIETKQ